MDKQKANTQVHYVQIKIYQILLLKLKRLHKNADLSVK